MAQTTQLLKGILQGCTLAILSDGELYGYKIVEHLKEYGFIDIHEATVYPILTRLEKKGILKFIKRSSELGPPRKYYSLTTAGEKELTAFSTTWKSISKNVDTILKENSL